METKEEIKKGSISMVEANLPPGFRFHPRDDELVCDYLMKRTGHSLYQPIVLIEVDLNKCEPWDIPKTARVGGKEWYFYSQKDRKYATGQRTNRATATGYWKATGKDRAIQRNGSLVGMRKTLVFYRGRAPKGRKTDWVMHEFRLQGTLLHHSPNSLKMVLRALLSQLTKKAEKSQSYGEGSSESQLTDIGNASHAAWNY
ncbi:unnamed protein product [Arabis nemorensis]|uniref:NAC domain-containing protein n=1 Tax=Arabis nemorensis TaxID=586526 RepID=A0A565B7X8_9BRAS|nr:unnamed protein product [Arabis nemorensis]